MSLCRIQSLANNASVHYSSLYHNTPLLYSNDACSVHVRVCVYVHVCECRRARLRISPCVLLFVFSLWLLLALTVWACAHVLACTATYFCTPVHHIHADLPLFVCLCICVFVCVCVYVHVCVLCCRQGLFCAVSVGSCLKQTAGFTVCQAGMLPGIMRDYALVWIVD